MSSRRIAVCLEATPQRTFASALDWPGWCRAGRDEGAALEALSSGDDGLLLCCEDGRPIRRQASG